MDKRSSDERRESMPEGWKRLQHETNRNNDCVVSITSKETQEDLSKALDLMKEMAEALKSLLNETDHIETESAPTEFWKAEKHAKDSITKFKEWK